MESLHEFVEWFEKEGYPEQASIDACYEVEKVLENVKDTLEEEFDMIEKSSDGLPKNDVYYRVTGHLTSLLDEVSGRLFRMKEEPYFKK
jgi:hypothetical protein